MYFVLAGFILSFNLSHHFMMKPGVCFVLTDRTLTCKTMPSHLRTEISTGVSGMLETKIKNNMGVTTLPWGTPAVAENFLLLVSLIFSYTFLCERKECTHLINFVCILILLSLSIKPNLHTASKAFSTSRQTTATISDH